MKSNIPNLLTSLNLFCGSVAVIALLNEQYFFACMLVLCASILDFLDGFLAKILKVQSELGKQLDSLADMISFGLVPGIILYIALRKSLEITGLFGHSKLSFTVLPFCGLCITVFSAIRLAKFNIDTRQSSSFIGLPTPANTLFFLSIPLIWTFYPKHSMVFQLSENTILLLCLTFLFSYLLIAEIPLFSLKFQNFSWKKNKDKYLLIFGSFVLILIFSFLAIPFIIILYLILSVFNLITIRKK